MGIFGDGNHSATVDTRAFFDSDIGERAADLVQMGMLVAFGSTRDRGALSIQVTCDGEWDRQYFRDSHEACGWLKEIAERARAAGMGEPAPIPSVKQTPRRRQRGVL